MFCSVCRTNTVSLYNQYSAYAADGVPVCNICYGEINNILNFINKDRKNKSISYPSDYNWGKRWVEEVTKEKDGFLSDLAVAFREKIHSDIKVKPGGRGRAIPAHKFLLAARSEIFKTMLASDTCKVAPAGSISLPEFSYEELKTFLEFLYGGSLAKEKFKKHFYTLTIAADKYVIPHLQKFCEQQILNMLDASNALKVLEISEYKNEIVLLPHFEEFARQNPHLMVHITRASLTCFRGK
ncbi:hypothetical protein MKW98_026661 [Papaver atlanticum]|uniref:BTB domain-containing protein n=1 Tax=Papaver atlanticum TaxID=357466 RepID=A0AAD4S0Q8_9MAGN|nr:hypothetical protein MKW98_026661 [Papaver atlanticum]